MTSTPYVIPLKNQLARGILRPLFRLIFYAISRVTITGKENVPPSGAYLIATNHVSLFEAPLIVSFWPIAPEAFGAAEIWERPGQATLARLYKGIPVHRGEFDRTSLDLALSVLAASRPLLIAPEGTRSHQPGMQRAHSGVAFLVEKAQVPVVPLGIVGSTDDFLFFAFTEHHAFIWFGLFGFVHNMVAYLLALTLPKGQLLAIFVNIDLFAGNASFHRGFGDCWRNP